MDMKSVSSSNIAAVGYDEESKTLRVEFNSGKTYEYSNVDKIIYEGLLNANSVGSYFNNNIRNFYGYQEI